MEMEFRAHELLLAQGCIPCYSFDPEVQADERNHINGAFEYFQTWPEHNGMPLCNQWLDWRKFRVRQQVGRRHHALSQSLPNLQEEINQRRMGFNLTGRARIEADALRQNKLDTWFEFQDHHMTYHQGLERELQELHMELDEMSRSDNASADDLADMYEALLEEHQKCDSHSRFLDWTERQRMFITCELYPLPTADDPHCTGSARARYRSMGYANATSASGPFSSARFGSARFESSIFGNSGFGLSGFGSSGSDTSGSSGFSSADSGSASSEDTDSAMAEFDQDGDDLAKSIEVLTV